MKQKRQRQFVDLTGVIFNEFTIIKYNGRIKVGIFKIYMMRSWLARCSCGIEKIVKESDLKSGRVKSCGHLNNGNARRTHGRTHTPEYNSWRGMIERCYNKLHINYKNYGGRGITVCDRWRYSFENFLEDMGEKPEPKSLYSLDRIEDSLIYYKEKCKWSTHKEQGNNRRPRKSHITKNGRFISATKEKITNA